MAKRQSFLLERLLDLYSEICRCEDELLMLQVVDMDDLSSTADKSMEKLPTDTKRPCSNSRRNSRTIRSISLSVSFSVAGTDTFSHTWYGAPIAGVHHRDSG